MVLVSHPKRDKADTVYKNALHEVVQITGEGRATLKDMTSSRSFDRNVKHLKRFVERGPIQEVVDGEDEASSRSDLTSSKGQQNKGLPTAGTTGDRHKESGASMGDEPIPKRRATRIIKRPQRYINNLEYIDYQE
nr:uncharacterized protein LOC115269364 [Aedes albopictus]